MSGSVLPLVAYAWLSSSLLQLRLALPNLDQLDSLPTQFLLAPPINVSVLAFREMEAISVLNIEGLSLMRTCEQFEYIMPAPGCELRAFSRNY